MWSVCGREGMCGVCVRGRECVECVWEGGNVCSVCRREGVCEVCVGGRECAEEGIRGGKGK